MSARVIPKISDKDLARLCKKIKPIIRQGDGFYEIKKVNPRTVAFLWDPKPARAVVPGTMICSIKTFHDFGAPSLFKPSIAEVIAQIPKRLINEVRYFETDADTAALTNVFGDDVHVVITRLYRGATK